MSKEKLEEVIEYEDEELDEDYIEDQEELSDNDQVEQDSKGQVNFKSVNHHKRAEANEVESDGEIATYVNYALEYFGYRCALSGEKFVIFDNPVEREGYKRNSNLSAEHILALTAGGNDIIPNIVPSVLQYNIQKNGYYILDWWPKAKDINGNPIYIPEKLLKIVNYMLKSLQIRKDLGIKKQPREYRKRLLTPNEIDEFLMQEGIAQGLISDTITAATELEDGKSILTQIPPQEGAIPSLAKQKYKETKITEAMFLTDALEVLGKEEKIPQEITAKLQSMYKEIEGEIPFEIEVRRNILSDLEQMGIEDNKYTVANDLLVNSDILEQVRNTENSEYKILYINEYLSKKTESLKQIFSEEYLKEIISYKPEVLYDFKSSKEEKELIDLYIKYTDNNKINIKNLSKIYLRNILEIKKWMEENKTIKPPRYQNKKNIVPKNEAKLGSDLVSIRSALIKPYRELNNEEEKEEYKRKHPELEYVMAIVEEIDRNNVKIKGEQKYYINILKIKEWMKENKTTKPPRKQNEKKTVPEEEAKLGRALATIKQELIKPYKDLKNKEEKEEYKMQHPELEEIMAIIEEIDRNNVKIKEEQPHYINILKIREWMEENKTTKPPNKHDKDKKTAKLGIALSRIRQELIKPYLELKNKEKKAEYKKQHPELEEVMKIVEEIDKNNILIKEEKIYYINMLKIKEWMKENKTTKPPRKQNEKKTVPEEEAKLGGALATIKQELIKPYIKMQDEEEKVEYRIQHPEIEDVMAVVEEIDRNNPKNKKKIKDTVKQNKDNLSEAMQAGEELESEKLMTEKVEEMNKGDGIEK